MNLTVKSLGVLSLGKVMGSIYGLFGFIFGAIFSLFSLVGGMGMMASEQGGEQAFAMFFGMGAVILLPLFYGAMGFLAGLLTALIYNLCAGFIGGLEMDVEGVPAAPAATPTSQYGSG